MNPPPKSAPALSAADRREQLLLLCSLDRARLQLILRPEKATPSALSDWAEQARVLIPWMAPLAPVFFKGWKRKLALGGLGLLKAFR